MSDLDLDRTYRKGDRGPKVVLTQEWLCLNGYRVLIDGSFGPASEFAVRQFQKGARLRQDGRVGPRTFAALIRPMTNALKPIAPAGPSLGDLVCRHARRHFKSAPREIGGQNKGPWVRLYMDGRQGEDWPWCAGFACFILRQACETLEVEPPLTPSVSCDSLAASARERGIFLAGAPGLDPARITPGSLFLSRRTGTDWTHTGIVLGRYLEVLETIEGNTNDDGGREGYEVCHGYRGLKGMDFVVL
jgi:hypothetical protein